MDGILRAFFILLALGSVGVLLLGKHITANSVRTVHSCKLYKNNFMYTSSYYPLALLLLLVPIFSRLFVGGNVYPFKTDSSSPSLTVMAEIKNFKEQLSSNVNHLEGLIKRKELAHGLSQTQIEGLRVQLQSEVQRIQSRLDDLELVRRNTYFHAVKFCLSLNF